jgi:hypothetical protein
MRHLGRMDHAGHIHTIQDIDDVADHGDFA